MALTADRINREDVSSLIGWWRDAGVDGAVSEVAVDWLALGSPQISNVANMVPPPAPLVEELPDTLSDFADWLLTSPNIPEAGPPERRVAPSGDPGSGFMILLDMPELADVDAGHLLSGEVAELVDKMLGAMGRDRSSVYITSLSPGRTPTGRLPETALDRLSEIARHHVRLVGPEKLWLMGRAASRALLGMDEVAGRGSLHVVNHLRGKAFAIASAHPRILLQTPKRKAEVWADMQRLLKGNDA
jgi:uracil-DNA glycosylase